MIKTKKKVLAVLVGSAFVCALMFSSGFNAFSSGESAAIDNASLQLAGDWEFGGTGGG